LLTFSDAQIAAVNDGPFVSRSIWRTHFIPAGSYPGQEAPLRTVAQPNFLAVQEEVGIDAVYWITRTLFENLDALRAAHPAMRTVGLDHAIAGLPVPLHPGARRYFREIGVATPSD